MMLNAQEPGSCFLGFRLSPFSLHALKPDWDLMFILSSSFFSIMSTVVPAVAVTGGPANNVSDVYIVYYINLLFASLLVMYTIIRLPRLFSLLRISSEWKNGHTLHYTPYRPKRSLVQALQGVYPPPKDNQTDELHTLYSHAYHVQCRLTEKGTPVTMDPPPHIPACIKPLRPLLTLFHARIAPGFSVAQMLIISTYFCSLLYAGLYKCNIFTDSARTGWICIGQIHFVLIFAQKNNVLRSVLGYGYEKVCFYPNLFLLLHLNPLCP